MTISNGGPPEAPVAGPGEGSLVGHLFGNYRVERRLAAGGMGEVFLVRHTTLEDKYSVVKTILPEFSARADIRERFDREARAVAQLGDHPHIVGIQDYGMMEDGRLWMMMPFVHGQPLDEYLRAQGSILPAYRVLEILIDVALALDHAHGLGIIHRDIKPSNVFVSFLGGAPACKLLDFGIARQRGNKATSQTRAALGTPSYMATEQYEYAAEAEAPADIYALACMAWEMESGAPPWPDDDVSVLYHKKLNIPPPPPLGGSMSPEREAFLRMCVAPNPSSRPQSVRSFITGYAATIPAASRFVPSGTQLVERRASILLVRDATETTVRRPPDATKPGAPLFPGLPAQSPAPAQSAMHQTTLGSASAAVGRTEPGGASRPSRMIGLGVVTALAASLGVYAVASHHGATSPAIDRGRAATSGPNSPPETPAREEPPAPPASSAAPAPPPTTATPTTRAVRRDVPTPSVAPSSSTTASAHTPTAPAAAETPPAAAPAPAAATPPAVHAPAAAEPTSKPTASARPANAAAVPKTSAKPRDPAPSIPSATKPKFNPNAAAGD